MGWKTFESSIVTDLAAAGTLLTPFSWGTNLVGDKYDLVAYEKLNADMLLAAVIGTE